MAHQMRLHNGKDIKFESIQYLWQYVHEAIKDEKICTHNIQIPNVIIWDAVADFIANNTGDG